MRMRQALAFVLVAATLIVVVARPTLVAQGLPQDVPLQGGQLPGTVPAEALSGLVLGGSASAGFDANQRTVVATGIDIQNPLFQGSSTHAGGDVDLQYSSPAGRRFEFGTGWATSFRNYQAADLISVNHSAGLGMSAGITRHLSVHANASGSYGPRYQFDLLPSLGSSTLGQVSAPTLDYALSIHQVLSYVAGGGLSYQPTKRMSFEMSYAYRDVNTDTAYFGGRSQDAYAAVHYGLTKGLGVRLGYRYQLSHYIDPATGDRRPVRGDNIDVGLDYGLSRGLMLSQRTKLTFGLGTGAFNDGRYSRFRFVGNANLTQQLSRGWDLGVAYARGMNFVDGFGAPIFSDQVNTRLVGELSQRVRAQASFGYGVGGIDDLSAVSRYRSYRGVVGIDGVLTRHLNAFVQYVNYFYAFDDTALIVQGVPARVNRQGVRVGVNFRVPLLAGREPKNRAPRRRPPAQRPAA